MKKVFSFLLALVVVLAISPFAHADGDIAKVAMTKKWTIQFDQSIDPKSVTTDTVYVYNEKTPSTKIPLTYKFTNNNKTMTSQLKSGTYAQGNTYELAITKGVKNTQGKALKKEITKTFTIENGCTATKAAVADDSYVVKVEAGDAIHVGYCIPNSGAGTFDYSYANSGDNFYFPYAGESEGYYFINANGHTFAVDKSYTKKLATSTTGPISYYELKNGMFNHYILRNHVTKKYDVGQSVSAPDFIKTGETYFSKDGSTFTDKNGKVVGTAYRYFQYASIRTKSNYTADELDQYISKNFAADSVMHGFGKSLIAAQEKYNLNALFLLAVASHESSAGTSDNAKKLKNIYSLDLKDVDPSKREFDSIDQNLNEFSSRILASYLSLTGGYSKGATVGNEAHGINAKYASDPFWGEGVANWMDKIDKSLGRKDKFAYTIGLSNSEFGWMNLRGDNFALLQYKTNTINDRGFTLVNKDVTHPYQGNDYYELIGEYGQAPGKLYGAKQYIKIVKTY